MSPRTPAILFATLLLTAACSDDDDTGAGGGTVVTTGGSGGTSTGSGTGTGNGGGTSTGTGNGGSGAGSSQTIASQYPGDVNIGDHPSVVWVEDFEAVDVPAVLSRYEDHKNQAGMFLEADVPAASSGSASMRMTAGGGTDATDFYKNFGTGWDELYGRWYVKYAADVQWHHTGVWIGGYRPDTDYPNPQAGILPNGADRFAVSIEPMCGDPCATSPRLDFYNYWMGMQTNPGGGFWGNVLVNDDALTTTNDWQCIEVHMRMNPDPGSAAGAELGVWLDDVSIVQYDDQGPVGRWLHDKFCRLPINERSASCSNWTVDPPDVVLDLQWRTTTELKINYFWPQNYITDGSTGDVWYDDMVLATERIGCIVPL